MAQILSFVIIFFYYFDGIDPHSWIISLTIAFVFLEDLNLRLISGRGIVGLSFVFVLVKSLIAVLLRGVVFVFFLANGLYPFGHLKSIFLVPE